MNFDDEVQKLVGPSRLWMGSITPAPVAQAPQGADYGSLEQALLQLAAAGEEGPTAANGYYIPEFTVDTPLGQAIAAPEPAPAAANFPEQQARANRMNANWNKQGFTFEVDPTTGTTTISNTEATRAKYGVGSGPNGTTPTATEAKAPANFRAQMAAIQAEKDPVQRAAMFADMQAQASVFKASIYRNTMQQAEAKLGIPELEARLLQNEQADRADPRWKEFQADSKMTAGVRQQLLRARGQADNETKQMLIGNSSIASIDAQIQAADAMFKRMETLQARADAREDASLDRMNATQENIRFRQQLEDQELLQATSPELLKRVQVIDPSLGGKDQVSLARFIHKGVKDKETQAALTATAEELPDMAVIGKNQPASKVLVAEEAQRTGKSQEQVAQELKSMQDGMFNDKLLQAQLRTLYAGQPEALRQIQTQLGAAKALGSTKQDIQQSEALRWQLVQRAASHQAGTMFLSDVGSWNMPDPALQAAIEQAKATSGKASAAEVLAAWVGTSTGPERQAKIQQFKQLFNTAVAPRTKSLLAPLNGRFLWEALEADINKKSVLERLQDEAGVGNNIALSMMALPGMPLINADAKAAINQNMAARSDDIMNFLGFGGTK